MVWNDFFWSAFIGLIIWLINKSKGETESIEETPLQIAKERYAQGEITRKEFQNIRREISE